MEFVTVRRCFNPAEAHLIASQLEAAGLTPFVRDEGAALSVEGYALSVGGIRVQVPSAQAPDAELLLSAPAEPTVE